MKIKNDTIAIAGNIGVGKTTLIQRLVKRFDWIPCYEPVETNPYLEDFYKDPCRYSFDLQVYFLSERLRRFKEIGAYPTNKLVILDRCVYEDTNIFARNLYLSRLMDERGYNNYLELSKIVIEYFEERQPLKAIFYLKNNDVDDIMKRIELRNRDCERSITREYVRTLNDLYEHWSLTDPKVVTIDVTGKDLYVKENLEDVVCKIQDVLTENLSEEEIGKMQDLSN